eukprot:4229489-Pyramimonas_sp.AAC.1
MICAGQVIDSRPDVMMIRARRALSSATTASKSIQLIIEAAAEDRCGSRPGVEKLHHFLYSRLRDAVPALPGSARPTPAWESAAQQTTAQPDGPMGQDA